MGILNPFITLFNNNNKNKNVDLSIKTLVVNIGVMKINKNIFL